MKTIRTNKPAGKSKPFGVKEVRMEYKGRSVRLHIQEGTTPMGRRYKIKSWWINLGACEAGPITRSSLRNIWTAA